MDLIHSHLPDSRLVRISSKDRSIESVSKYDIVFRPDDRDLHQIKKIALKGAEIPNTQYNIHSDNNLLYFPNSLSGTTDFTIPVGQYTTSTLITEIQSQIAGLVITQDTLTQKLTFTHATQTFDIVSNTTTNPMARTLGFLTDASGVGSHVCTGLPNLTGLKTVYIASHTLCSNTAMCTNDKLKQHVFCSIPITVPFGETQVIDEDSSTFDFSVFHDRKNIAEIRIKLLDEENHVLELNGLDWYIILRVFT
jgi:hypothetical protein